jgi:hypothetical protein
MRKDYGRFSYMWVNIVAKKEKHALITWVHGDFWEMAYVKQHSILCLLLLFCSCWQARPLCQKCNLFHIVWLRRLLGSTFSFYRYMGQPLTVCIHIAKQNLWSFCKHIIDITNNLLVLELHDNGIRILQSLIPIYGKW